MITVKMMKEILAGDFLERRMETPFWKILTRLVEKEIEKEKQLLQKQKQDAEQRLQEVTAEVNYLTTKIQNMEKEDA